MINLTIAGVRCRLLPETGGFVFGENLLPFCGPTDAADLTLRLSWAPGWQAEHLPLSDHHVRHHDGIFEFRRRGGLLIGRHDFACCEAHLDPEPPEAFSGQPWLMLTLWGYLAPRNGLFLHGACCEIGGKRLLLLGHSQVGKSTLARLIVEAGGACLTDEYPFVTRDSGGFLAHGTPWRGVKGPVQALSGPPDAICFLRHAPLNELVLLDRKEATRRLFANNRFFTWSPATIAIGVELIEELAGQVPVYDYGFVPTAQAVSRLVAGL